jgi:hypothetical protein
MLRDIINEQLATGSSKFMFKMDMLDDLDMIDILSISMKFEELEDDCDFVREYNDKDGQHLWILRYGFSDIYLLLRCVMLRKRGLVNGPYIRTSSNRYKFNKKFLKNAWEGAVMYDATHTAFGKFISEYGCPHIDEVCMSCVNEYLNPPTKSARNV